MYAFLVGYLCIVLLTIMWIMFLLCTRNVAGKLETVFAAVTDVKDIEENIWCPR